jgi:hypothetical protein
MYVLPIKKNEFHQSNMYSFKEKSAEALFDSISNDVEFSNVPFNHVLLFSQNIMHGNRVNTTHETRWSLNCRFKRTDASICR